jgi:hypothetical protein
VETTTGAETMTDTLDLKRQLRHLYKPKAKAPVLVDVPTMRFLMIDGVDGVRGPAFDASTQALMVLAYQVKFGAAKRLDLKYPVMPLEGLFWDAEEGPLAPLAEAEHLAWRLMVLLPDAVSREFVDEVRAKVAAKKDLPRLPDVRVQSLTEGASVQLLHVGPYAGEGPAVGRMRAFAAERGLEFAGAHHEIYLDDPSRAAQEKLRTGLRRAVRSKNAK